MKKKAWFGAGHRPDISRVRHWPSGDPSNGNYGIRISELEVFALNPDMRFALLESSSISFLPWIRSAIHGPK